MSGFGRFAVLGDDVLRKPSLWCRPWRSGDPNTSVDVICCAVYCSSGSLVSLHLLTGLNEFSNWGLSDRNCTC